jgi:UDP-N-acetylglucosamine 4,6-dehydratase/5-epimerase
MGSLDGRSILITGGTGSFGKLFIRTVLAHHQPRRLVVFSRDELKQSEMQQDPVFSAPCMRYFIGDVRDPARLSRALHGVDVVVHAAAMKQVPVAEYNPFEAIKTNVIGGQNVIEAALDNGVERVIALSTDKAACPVNLYGATKLCSDKLFVAANSYTGSGKTRFSVVRYGNVLGSRGSVVPLFLGRRHQGTLPVTDERMTRFWITLQQGANFVIDCLDELRGGEIFVPKIASMRMVDLARAIAPQARLEFVGIRPGEKLHEVMVPEDDARCTLELPDRYVILPSVPWPRHEYWRTRGRKCPEGFRYGSDTNDRWLTPEEIRAMIAALEIPEAREFARELEAQAA